MPINGAFTPYDIERVKNAIAFIEAHYQENISAEQLAVEVGMDIKLLRAGIRSLTNLTVHNYQLKRMINKATADLADFKQSIESIAKKHGFSSSSHFSRKFKEQNGLTPREYRFQLMTK